MRHDGNYRSWDLGDRKCSIVPVIHTIAQIADHSAIRETRGLRSGARGWRWPSLTAEAPQHAHRSCRGLTTDTYTIWTGILLVSLLFKLK